MLEPMFRTNVLGTEVQELMFRTDVPGTEVQELMFWTDVPGTEVAIAKLRLRCKSNLIRWMSVENPNKIQFLLLWFRENLLHVMYVSFQYDRLSPCNSF